MGEAAWWLVVCGVFLVAELGHRAFFAMFIALGAIVTAVFAFIGVPVIAQLAIFLAATVASITALRPTVIRAVTKDSPGLVSGMRAHIGHETVVTERVGGPASPGRIKLDGELWRAASLTGQIIEPGTVVMIVDLNGMTFTVEDLTSLGLNPMHLPEET